MLHSPAGAHMCACTQIYRLLPRVAYIIFRVQNKSARPLFNHYEKLKDGSVLSTHCTPTKLALPLPPTTRSCPHSSVCASFFSGTKKSWSLFTLHHLKWLYQAIWTYQMSEGKRVIDSQTHSLRWLGGWRAGLASGLLESSDLEGISFFSPATNQSHVGMRVRAQHNCRAPLGPSPVPWATFSARSLLNELISPDLASLRFLDNAWDLAASLRRPPFKDCGLSR